MSLRTPFTYVPGGPPNIKNYPFFVDEKLNKVIPPWFVPCDRSEAEKKLAKTCPNQNVILMRLSTTATQFVITAQTVCNGRTHFDHYGVLREKNSAKKFYIDISTQHATTKTLSEIMEVFLKLTEAAKYQIFNLPTMKQSDVPPASSSSTGRPPERRLLRSPSTTQQFPEQRAAAPAATGPAVTQRKMSGSQSNPSSRNAALDYLTPVSHDDISGEVRGSDTRVNGDYLTTNYFNTSSEVHGSSVNADYITTNYLDTPEAARSDYLTPHDFDTNTQTYDVNDPASDYCDVQGLTNDISVLRLPNGQQSQPLSARRH